MLRLNTRRPAVVFETWQKKARHWANSQLINIRRRKKRLLAHLCRCRCQLNHQSWPQTLFKTSPVKQEQKNDNKRMNGKIKMAGTLISGSQTLIRHGTVKMGKVTNFRIPAYVQKRGCFPKAWSWRSSPSPSRGLTPFREQMAARIGSALLGNSWFSP